MPYKITLLLFFLSILAGCKNEPGQEENTIPQTFPYHYVALADIANFNYNSPHHNNWSITGDVYADRNVTHSLEPSEGAGILVNEPNDVHQADLLFRLNHGDLDLELDFMMPKESDSGIWFQGRYELQLKDSWLRDKCELTYADCGGIYKGRAGEFEGSAPAVNASKAPGLWQHLKVRFRAPRFDSVGNKISNARFEWVYLNGALVQEDVEVSGYTSGAAFEDEKPLGPLRIQGSQGPVAFKNIRYKSYINDRIVLKDMQLKVYKSLYENIDTLKSLKPDRIIYTDTLSKKNYDEYEQGIYTGNVIVPASGDYIFKLQSGGPSWFWIDSELVVDNNRSYDYFHPHYSKIQLDKGEHTFKLIFNNRHQHILLGYESAQIPFTLLTTKHSRFPRPKAEPYIVSVDNETVFQRGFFMHDGEKRTHAIMAGFPGGMNMNYAYSLKNFNILSVWRGAFVDAAAMWRGRGEEQLARPLGGITELTDMPVLSLGIPGSEEGIRPDSLGPDAGFLTERGYRLNSKGEPIFFYSFYEVKVQDYIHPTTGSALVRELSFNLSGFEGPLYCLIASGRSIRQLPGGSYAIDNFTYYIDNIKSNKPPAIENSEKQDMLWVPVMPTDSVAKIKYSIIW